MERGVRTARSARTTTPCHAMPYTHRSRGKRGQPAQHTIFSILRCEFRPIYKLQETMEKAVRLTVPLRHISARLQWERNEAIG